MSSIRKIVEQANGSIFSKAGDSFGASFADPASATGAAIEMQRSLSSTAVGDVVLQVRIALHSGTAQAREGDFFGPVLNRCARILGIARGGQILVSAGTRGMLVDSGLPGVTFQDLGEHRLRDLTEPERLYLVRHPDLDNGDGRVDSLTSLPNNLPVSLSVFVGRAEELEDLVKLIRGGRLTTVTGAGGSGKTRLAIQAAADLVDEFPDGVWMAELAPVADADQVARAVASTLGVEESSSRPLLETLVDHLRGRRLLLLLDNCEHLIGSVAAMAENLLRSAAELTVVATSREGLGVPGETLYPLRSLSLPTDEGLGDRSRLRCRTTLRGAGRVGGTRLWGARGQRRCGGRDLSPPGRHAAGHRVGGGPAQDALRGGDRGAARRPIPHPHRRQQDRTAPPPDARGRHLLELGAAG